MLGVSTASGDATRPRPVHAHCGRCRGVRRTSPTRSPRGRCRGPAGVERFEALAPLRAAAAARRVPRRLGTRPPRGGARASRAGDRRAARARRRPARLVAEAASATSSFALRRCERALDPKARFGCELGSPLQERGGRGQPAPPCARSAESTISVATASSGRPSHGRGAMLDDRGRAPDRWRRPARVRRPDGRSASSARYTAERTSGCAKRTRTPSSINPSASAGRPASPPIPRRSAARHSRLTSPSGSDAATRRSSCVSRGSASMRCTKLCSMRLVSGRASREVRNRPRARPGVSPRGSSISASGLPVLSSRMRAFDLFVERTGDHRVEQQSGVVGRSPSITSSGNPSSTGRRPCSRTENTMPTRSAKRRRATNASVSDDTRSSHCASSTMHTSGCSSALSASRLRTASPTRNRSGGGPALRPNAVPDGLALRLRQLLDTSSSIGVHNEWRPAKASSISDSTPVAQTTEHPSRLPVTGAAARSCRARLAAQHQGLALPGPHAGDELTQRAALAQAVKKLRRAPRGVEQSDTH